MPDYAFTYEAEGTINLVSVDDLHESERAVLENRQLYDDTQTGLRDFTAGEGVSSDWLFDDDE